MFKTSKNRESPLFGKAVGTRFIIQGEGFHTKLVGFGGLSDPDRLIGLGAHLTVAPPRKTLVVKGGDTGTGSGWDDGIHGRVHKIRVANGWTNIYCIEFEYTDGMDDNIIVH